MLIDRRDLMSLLPAAIAQSALLAALSDTSSAQTIPGSGPLPSAAYPFENLHAHAFDTGEMRPILKGKLATGETIEVHETTLNAGGSPHPPHHHEHSEMWLIREGIVEISIVGKLHRLGPGSIGFVRSNEEHGITNPGDHAATYFVIEIGPTAGT